MAIEPCLVVFDVDGTLVDAQVSIINGFVSGFEAAGLTPPSAAAISLASITHSSETRRGLPAMCSM